MSNYRFPTYWHKLNLINRGGLVAPGIIELWGPPQAGKTLFCYDFIRRNKSEKAIIIIVDTELSSDETRLKMVFGLKKASYFRLNDKDVLVDGGEIVKDEAVNNRGKNIPHRYEGYSDGDYIICPYGYIERAFDQLTIIMKSVSDRERPIFVIYDSISSQGAKAELEGENMFEGGQMLRPRVLKFFAPRLLESMYNRPALVLCISHVFQDRTTGAYMAGGGNSFKHNQHTSIFFKQYEDKFDTTGTLATMSLSNSKVTKNKFGPKIKDSVLAIDVSKGGDVMVVESLLWDTVKLGIIADTGKGWFQSPIFGDKKKRFNDLVNLFVNDEKVRNKVLSDFEKKIYDVYPIVKAMKDFEDSE